MPVASHQKRCPFFVMRMLIFWISSILLGTLCLAQNNIISQSTAGGSPLFTRGSVSAIGGQLPGAQSSGVSASSSAGPSGASASTQVNTPLPYPACLASNPDDAVTSSSSFAYSLLEGSFTNPFLRGFYNTSFDLSRFYDVVYDEVKETLSKGRSQILAGSLSLLFGSELSRMNPILNAVSITNALSEIQGDEAIVITSDKEDYIEPYLTSISKAVSATDGSARSQARAVIRGLLEYLDYIRILTYSKLHEFTSIVAGEYRLAIRSTCKPSSFEVIPRP